MIATTATAPNSAANPVNPNEMQRVAALQEAIRAIAQPTTCKIFIVQALSGWD